MKKKTIGSKISVTTTELFLFGKLYMILKLFNMFIVILSKRRMQRTSADIKKVFAVMNCHAMQQYLFEENDVLKYDYVFKVTEHLS